MPVFNRRDPSHDRCIQQCFYLSTARLQSPCPHRSLRSAPCKHTWRCLLSAAPSRPVIHRVHVSSSRSRSLPSDAPYASRDGLLPSTILLSPSSSSCTSLLPHPSLSLAYVWCTSIDLPVRQRIADRPALPPTDRPTRLQFPAKLISKPAASART